MQQLAGAAAFSSGSASSKKACLSVSGFDVVKSVTKSSNLSPESAKAMSDIENAFDETENSETQEPPMSRPESSSQDQIITEI